jgi:hypothetical protein
VNKCAAADINQVAISLNKEKVSMRSGSYQQK